MCHRERVAAFLGRNLQPFSRYLAMRCTSRPYIAPHRAGRPLLCPLCQGRPRPCPSRFSRSCVFMGISRLSSQARHTYLVRVFVYGPERDKHTSLGLAISAHEHIGTFSREEVNVFGRFLRERARRACFAPSRASRTLVPRPCGLWALQFLSTMW